MDSKVLCRFLHTTPEKKGNDLARMKRLKLYMPSLSTAPHKMLKNGIILPLRFRPWLHVSRYFHWTEKWIAQFTPSKYVEKM